MNEWARWKVPLAFALVILLPVLLAALTLHQGWYEAGTRSKGQWLKREVYLLPPLSTHEGLWRLVYLEPERCEALCQQVPALMQRIQSALGRNGDKLALVPLPLSSLGTAKGLQADELMLVDPQGLAILHYEVPDNSSQWPRFGKAVLSDLQQLLKYQRGVQ